MNRYTLLAFGILTSLCLAGCSGDPGEDSENDTISTQEQASRSAAIDPNALLPRATTADAGVATYRLANPLGQPCIQCPDRVLFTPRPGY